MITFNNIVERFQIFADNHFFIKTFSFGSPDDVDLSKFTTFPLMHLVYTGATYDAGTKTYNLEIYILDVPSDKNGKVSRQKEVVSDAEQCAEDIIADIKNGGNIFLFAQDYEVVNATTTPLEEETKNVLSGVLLDLSVSIPYEWDACNAPIDGVEPGGTDVTYARRGVLRMLTLDGATDVPSVRTIKVTNGTLTDDGDGVVTLDTGGVDTLAQLTDVQIIDPEQGDVLSYNAGVQKWMVNGGLQQLLAKFKASASGAQMFDTLNDTTKGYIDLLATSATMKVNVTGIEISEASPGVLTFSVAAGTEGNEVEFEAVVITGSNSLTTAADVVFKQGATTYFENSTGRIWLRVPNAGNITVVLPSSGGTLALTSQALPVGGTTGQALIKSSGTDYDVEWADISVDVQYHDRYQSDAASFRSGATATTEIYYSAIADGDGYAQSASTDTPTTGYDIRRKLYYSEAGFADPDTGTWTQFANIADNTTFANAKTALLAYLKARTGGTVPISLKMTWEEVQQAPAFTGLLNESYGSGAAAAYGTRRLNGNYTGACMTIRRASDGTTTTIGFVGEEIDESAITTFCTGTTCTVQVWHDQSQSGGTGSGNDATQTTPANQPTIYTGGQLVKEGGRLALDFDGTDELLPLSDYTITNSANKAVFLIAKNEETATVRRRPYSIQASGSTRVAFWNDDNNTSSWTGNGFANSVSITGDVSTLHLLTGQDYAGSQSIYLNGVAGGTNSSGGTNADGDEGYIGSFDDTGTPAVKQIYKGKILELITYHSNKSTDRTSIEGNISAYYQSAKLLDEQYGENAAAAYSVRQLKRDNTECMVIRRASDGTTTTIGFDGSGNIDESAINTFCSGTTCTVQTWKDQSGNGNDATQATVANQPTIYTGGAIVKQDGRVALDFDGSDDFVKTSDYIVELSQNAASVFALSQTDATGINQYLLSEGDNNSPYSSQFILGGGGGFGGILWVNSTKFGEILAGKRLLGFDYNQSTFQAYLDGNTNGSAAAATVNTETSLYSYIGSRADGTTSFLNGKVYELITYKSNKSTDRTSIESNIGGYFTQNTPLLDTYTGAAAAYSLRKLRSAFSGSAIRVRRASDNTEQDINFNVFKELSTVELAAFCGSSDGFVVKWYDQSGNANDATQTTAANQPKIYDSVTGVVTKNGKPAILFDGLDDGYLTPLASSDPSTYFITCDNNGNSGKTPASPTQINAFYIDMRTALRVRVNGTEFTTATQTAVDFQLQYILHNITASEAAVNGATVTNGTVGAVNGSVVSIGQAPLGGKWLGHIFELVIYQSDQSTNRTNIESNINTFYSIY